MIVIGLGSNQNGPWGSPEAAVTRALTALNRDGLRLIKASRLMVSKAFGVTDQPDFVNAVARIDTALDPVQLMRHLQAIERDAGRHRAGRWGPRTLDLDLIDYDGLVMNDPSGLILPHPGIAERLFVLKPMAEIAPGWVHPVVRQRARTMIKAVKPGGAGDEA